MPFETRIVPSEFRPHSGFYIVVCVGVMSLCDVFDFEWIYHNQHCKFSSVMYVFPLGVRNKETLFALVLLLLVQFKPAVHQQLRS